MKVGQIYHPALYSMFVMTTGVVTVNT